MKSKKLIFLTLVALSFMSTAVNAWRDRYYDDNDDYENVVYEDEHGPGIVRGTGRVAEGAVEGTGRVVEGTGKAVGEVGRGAADLASAPFKMFGGD